jgi:hypothetical protein
MADEADDPTSDRFLEVYLLWLFVIGWRRDTGRRRDTRCCRLVTGRHGDTVS